MKLYMSYWSYGCSGIPSIFTINLHKLSVFLAKKYFKEVHFLTDSRSKNYFNNIPFDSVKCIFDDIDPKYNPVWSISKLVAYKYLSKLAEPFLHMDYDVLLWKPLPQQLLDSDFFVQHEEYNIQKKYEINKFLQNCPNLYLINKLSQLPTNALNCGIFGGKNLNFIENYATLALNMILDKNNEECFVNLNIFENYWTKSVFVEQYYLSVCCQYFNIKPNFYFDKEIWLDIYYDNKKELFEMEPWVYDYTNFTHLMSNKNLPETQNYINTIVKKLNL